MDLDVSSYYEIDLVKMNKEGEVIQLVDLFANWFQT